MGNDKNLESGCRQFAEPNTHPHSDIVRKWRRNRQPHVCLRTLAFPIEWMGGSIFAFAFFVSCVVFMCFYLVLYAGVCLFWCFTFCSSNKTPYEISTSDILIYPLIYIMMCIGAFVFLAVFVPYCLVWWLFVLVLWLLLWTSSHLPGLRQIIPKTTPTHLGYFLPIPVREP